MPRPAETATYYGQVMHIMFETSTDLSLFMPAGLSAVDPHRAFIKAERLKIRSAQADGQPAAFSHYQQICIATLASFQSFGTRHRNMLMWEDRHWAIGNRVAGKRYGSIEMTQVFEQERALIDKGQPVPFFVDVQTDGFSLMRFAGALDGELRVSAPAYGGFFVGGEPEADLMALSLRSHDLSRPLYGTGTLAFGAAPNERSASPVGGVQWPASLLRDIRTEGCVLHDITFTRAYGTDSRVVRSAVGPI